MWPVLVIGGAMLWLRRARRNPQLSFMQELGYDERWPELRASKYRAAGSFATGQGSTRLYHTGIYGYKAERRWLLKKLGHVGDDKPNLAVEMALQACMTRTRRDRETGETLVEADFSRFVDRQRDELDKYRARRAI